MQTRTSRQHPEIGTVALRLLWIPAVASIAVAGYLMLRTPQDDRAPADAHAAASVASTAPLRAPSKASEAAAAQPDAAIAAHELLDPVGAGHDVAR